MTRQSRYRSESRSRDRKHNKPRRPPKPPYGSNLENDEWVRGMVKWYKIARPFYIEFGEVLQRILSAASIRYAPLAIVQNRSKKVASFAEKLWRKIDKYRQTDDQNDPVHPVADLCGASSLSIVIM